MPTEKIISKTSRNLTTSSVLPTERRDFTYKIKLKICSKNLQKSSYIYSAKVNNRDIIMSDFF